MPAAHRRSVAIASIAIATATTFDAVRRAS